MELGKHKRIWAVFGALTLTLCLLAGCGEKNSGEITSLEQLKDAGRIIGVAADTAEDRLVAQEFPLARIEYFNEEMAAYTSVSQGKIDAFVFNKRAMESAIYHGMKGVRLLDETVGEGNISGVAISPVTKIPDLEGKVNTFLREMKADGTLDDAVNRWLILHDETMPEIAVPQTSELHLVVGTTGTNTPFTYYVGTELGGYDVELARRFASWLGATLEFKVYNYDGIIAAAQSGDVDCIFANLFQTPERMEALTFSEPTYVGEIGVMVRSAASPADGREPGQVRWQDYDGKRLGVLVGPLMEDAAAEYFPHSETLLFNTYPDCIAALQAGKIDAYLADEPGMKSTHAAQPEIDYIHDNITENNYSFAFRKDDPESAVLCAELNEFLAQCQTDGTMQELDEIWFGVDEARKTVDLTDLTGENGTVKVVTTSTDMPVSYIQDGTNVGYDIDLVARFCRAKGYALELGDVDFAGRIPAIQSGRYDFTTDMNVTPEREEQVLFSDPTSHGGIVLAVLSSDLTAVADVSAGSSPEYRQYADLSGKTVSMLNGAPFEDLVRSHAPDVGEFTYFNNTPDMILALKSGKTDAFLINNAIADLAVNRNPELSMFPQNLQDGVFGIAFAKDDPARDAWQTAFETIPAETKQALWEKWTGSDDSLKTLPEQDWPGLNGTVKAAVCDTLEPMSYMGDDEQLIGFDVEMILLMAKELDVHVEFVGMEFSAVMSSVQAGKALLGAGSIIVTEERKQSVDFVEYYPAAFVLVVRNTQRQATESVFSAIAQSFEKTFLRENRWELFLSGIGTTLLITALSILLGTALGFGVFLLCRNGNPVANGITRFFVWLVQGMPVVVLLMILYYIIFGKVAISGTLVSIVGFTLVFGSAVYAMVKAGVGTVDQGQTEAAYTLGYPDRKAFFRIVLPQALPHFMPAYKGEITSLIKATAIVGYVAVQDLTKMGDIVRSRTYEAFFPLIAVAVIYFILAAILTFLVNRIEIRIDPRRKSRDSILKGVNTGD